MRTKIKNEVTLKELVCIDITCDKCGKNIAIDAANFMFTGVTMHVDAGYGSAFDMSVNEAEVRSIDICDNCFDDFHSSLRNKII